MHAFDMVGLEGRTFLPDANLSRRFSLLSKIKDWRDIAAKIYHNEKSDLRERKKGEKEEKRRRDENTYSKTFFFVSRSLPASFPDAYNLRFECISKTEQNC